MSRWRYLKGSFGLWFGLIWAFVGTIFFCVGVGIFARNHDFETRAVGVAGTVAEKGHASESKGKSRYWVRYEWKGGSGEEYSGVGDIEYAVWSPLEAGAPIAVRYLADDPARNKPIGSADSEEWVLPGVFTFLGLVFGGIGWGLVIGAYVGSGRRVRLVAHGTAAVGHVREVAINRSVRINGRHPSFIVYEFEDDRGETHEGRSINLPRDLETRWQEGDPILVLYDHNRPERSEVDLFGVRADELTRFGPGTAPPRRRPPIQTDTEEQ